MTHSETDLLARDRAALDSGDPHRWAHRALGVVLAGGQGQRMGGVDKPLLEIGGQSLLVHCVDRLTPQVDQVIISSNGDLDRFPMDNPVIPDQFGGFAGPLAGIHAAMRWAKINAPHTFWVISAAADTPFFPDDLVLRCVQAMGGPEPSVVLAQSGENTHPTFGLWPVTLVDDLEEFLTNGGRKVRQWAHLHNDSRAIFEGFPIDDLSIDPFFNINEPDDIEVAKVIAEALSESD